jgi:hypothetical protein
MPFLLGPVLDLVLIAMLSRHRLVWLGLAATVACLLTLLVEPPGHAAGIAMDFVGGTR